MTVGFYTLGCKVNQYETQALSALFASAGIATVPLSQSPDMVVLNSCTVTAESDRKDRQALRRLRREHPEAILILTGCMPQAFPEQASQLPEADIITGNGGNDRLLALVEEFSKKRAQIIDIPDHGEAISPLCPDGFGERSRAYIKIEDGCNRFCSYCIIPTARGRVRSKSPQAVAEEAKALAQKGFREVVLVGINLSAYGLKEEYDLADGVEAVAAIPGIQRIRLGSLEPDQLTPAIIDRLAACQKLCPQFHLSLQSGCDTTLHRMNRHYDTAFYRDLCTRLRRRFGGEDRCAITTDVMVGFPGETEEEFEASLAFVKEIGFAKAHVFAYSRRKGTVADRAEGQISAAQKAERSRRMIETTAEGSRRFLKSQIGQIQEVLIESRSPDGFAHGVTPNYTPVRLSPQGLTPGELVQVQITGVDGEDCLGRPLIETK